MMVMTATKDPTTIWILWAGIQNCNTDPFPLQEYDIDIEEEEDGQVRIDGELKVVLDRTTGWNTRIICNSIHTESLASGNN